ncbi:MULTISPECIES: trypsin-like serine peptidase [unclassified Luteimonas]
MRRTVLSLCLTAVVATAAAADAPRVHSEASRTPATKSATGWRAADTPVAQLRYSEMSAQRIHRLQQDNASRSGKPIQIGIAREAAVETSARALPALQWTRLADGSSVARIEFVSPLAYGVRAGLRIDGLDPRAELRFAGSAQPGHIVAIVRGQQAAGLAGDDGLYWTPTTEGERQILEIWLPTGTSPNGVQIDAPRLSHLMANAVDEFRILKNIGGSGSCNVNAVCRVGELGQGYALTKDAVARMVFVSDGVSYLCTGTLLNDTDSATQVPWFHTADHCIDSAQLAATLNTYWKYESIACDTNSVGGYVQLSGGADYQYSSSVTDGALLRLRDAAPAGAVFAGWDANALPSGISVLAIHHPAGDLKKVSSGHHATSRSTGARNAASWLNGTTEQGSSGSGLFTLDGGNYYLRGGLQGGYASCANSNTTHTDNIDWYSRFDVDFPAIRQYLAPEQPTAPRRRNGSQPLRPR